MEQIGKSVKNTLTSECMQHECSFKMLSYAGKKAESAMLPKYCQQQKLQELSQNLFAF